MLNFSAKFIEFFSKNVSTLSVKCTENSVTSLKISCKIFIPYGKLRYVFEEMISETYRYLE